MKMGVRRMEELDRERRARFAAAALRVNETRGAERISALSDVMAVIAEDMSEIASRYGTVGLPFVAASMTLVAGSIKGMLPDNGKAAMDELLRVFGTMTVVIDAPGQKGENGHEH